MAIDPKLMELMKNPTAGGGAGQSIPQVPPSAGAAGSSVPPVGAPLSTPETPSGEKESAKVGVQIAIDMLTQSAQALGMDSAEGKTVLQCISTLSRQFGKRQSDTRELMPAEIMNLIQTLPGAGGASPEQKVAAQAPIPGTQTPPLPM